MKFLVSIVSSPASWEFEVEAENEADAEDVALQEAMELFNLEVEGVEEIDED